MNKMFPLTPGEVLYNQYMKPRSVTVEDLAKAIGTTTSMIQGVIDGNPVGPVMAVCLGKVFGTSPEFWVYMQIDYELSVTKKMFEKWNPTEIFVEKVEF